MEQNRALRVARRAADELAENGARAVVLVGSHSRGDAGPVSDVDLLATGNESYLPRLERRDGFLISVSMQPHEVHQESFEQPELICTAVPGWRDALILHDPEGLSESLIREAREWSWGPLERRCDEWVAEKITGYAEEVFKLVAALGNYCRSTAAVQRSLLAMHLAPVLAVHHRILYGSENRLWDLLSEELGEEWTVSQSAALGLGGESFEESCAAALNLYGLAAAEVAHLMDRRQREVVGSALDASRLSV